MVSFLRLGDEIVAVYVILCCGGISSFPGLSKSDGPRGEEQLTNSTPNDSAAMPRFVTTAFTMVTLSDVASMYISLIWPSLL